MEEKSKLATAETKPTPRKYSWIGPVFFTGVSLEGIGEIKPHVITDKDIDAIIKDYPALARYWKVSGS
jgi:hypothetical protein